MLYGMYTISIYQKDLLPNEELHKKIYIILLISWFTWYYWSILWQNQLSLNLKSTWFLISFGFC